MLDRAPPLRVYSNSSSLSASEMTKMMISLSIRCDSTLYDQFRDFSLFEKQFFVFTGLTWENIRQIVFFVANYGSMQLYASVKFTT